MSWTAQAYLAVAAAYAAFQWTVRLLVYPQFAMVDRIDFAAYEIAHQRRITPLVGVLFLALGVGALLLFGWPPPGRSHLPGLVGGLIVAAILGLTAVGAVPRHTTLRAGWNDPAFRTLLRIDSARVVLATANVILAAASLR